MKPEKKMKSYPISSVNKVKRIAKKAVYDRKTIYSIIDEALFCHIGFIYNNQPVVIPTIHARIKDHLVFHGSNASRLIKTANNNHLCVTITILDGLVLARSHFNSSMNYRSVVLFGKGELIADETERWEAFKTITEHLMPGRWNDARQPNKKELKQTAVLKMKIDSASAKISDKFPEDEPEDYDLNFWAGIIPIKQFLGQPINDPKIKSGVDLPEYLKDLIK